MQKPISYKFDKPVPKYMLTVHTLPMPYVCVCVYVFVSQRKMCLYLAVHLVLACFKPDKYYFYPHKHISLALLSIIRVLICFTYVLVS